jgi:tetratricopeptide (TPR) repeat protein
MAFSMYYRDSEIAERPFQRAIELDPSYARARRMYASHLRNLGRFDEALAEVRQAQELDPLSAFPRLEEESSSTRHAGTMRRSSSAGGS